jgi:5'-nucleotidase
VRILVTNDDGVDSEGLHVLARTMHELTDDVVVVAPDTEYSGAGASLGALQHIQPEVRRHPIDGVGQAWALNGPPALCVMFARLGAFGPRFDLVVAGINPGANVGRSVYHSGTVGAALTARLGGISGVAVSQAVKDFGIEGQGSDVTLGGQRWHTAATVARSVVAAMIVEPPEPTVINLNVPNVALGDVRGWQATKLGTTPMRSLSEVSLAAKPGHPGSYRINMNWGKPVSLPADSDGGAIERGYVSLSFLSSLCEVDPAGAPQITQALDKLLAL